LRDKLFYSLTIFNSSLISDDWDFSIEDYSSLPWLDYFLLCRVEIALVRIGFCIKCKLHFTPTALSSNCQFHFRQSLTKTLQFLAKHGLPLLLLWLVMASGFGWEGTPFFTFPSLIFTILTHLNFKIRLSRIFPSLANMPFCLHPIFFLSW
jgi:hypothetical protein